MDWIDTKSTDRVKNRSSSSEKSKKTATLQKQVAAAMAQPASVWAAGFEHSLSAVKWPSGTDVLATWMWSTVIQEQAEVLVRAGASVRKIAGLVDDGNHSSEKSRIASISGMMHEPLETKIFEWLEQSDAYPQAALGVIAATWHLPEHARRSDAVALSRWVCSMTQQVEQRRAHQCDCLLGNLVFHCELPLLLDLLTATPKHAAGLVASRAMDDLAEYLENSQEHIAAWLAHGASYLRAALATIFRCRVLADHLGLRNWYPPQRKALKGLLENAAQWARSDGTQLLGYGKSIPETQALWKTLAKQAGSSRSTKRFLTLSGILDEKRPSSLGDKKTNLPALSHHSEEAQCATMRHSWYHRCCGLAIDFSESNIQIEAVGPKGIALLRGVWTVSVALDGQPQYQMDGWDENCWFSDDDVDYIEVEAKFGEQAKVQRQLILFRKQRFILTADALLCDREGIWTISSELPLEKGLQWQTAGKNSEGFLTGNASRSLVVPLFLPEWRSQPRTGDLQSDGNRLQITNATHGGASVYSPLLISLANRIANQPYTWRQLTVAEDRLITGRDQAVGYRVQFGKKQYLMYRNLAMATKRSLLGVHLTSDFYAGVINKDTGDVESLVEIEAS